MPFLCRVVGGIKLSRKALTTKLVAPMSLMQALVETLKCCAVRMSGLSSLVGQIVVQQRV